MIDFYSNALCKGHILCKLGMSTVKKIINFEVSRSLFRNMKKSTSHYTLKDALVNTVPTLIGMKF